VRSSVGDRTGDEVRIGLEVTLDLVGYSVRLWGTAAALRCR
jgi:hypothetical protein